MKRNIYKKIMSLTVAAFTALSGIEPISTGISYAADNNAASYTYEVTPLLTPFNEFFFVRTNNPDPTSFRFSDKSSVYGQNAYLTPSSTVYADVEYDDTDTLRVNGGYIFCGSYTDGGEIVLQTKNGSVGWKETNVKLTLPALKSEVDYLVDTYSSKNKSFFENMDAVQSGFSSVCLYSGSSIRGEIYKAADYWALSCSPHIDQTFYIQSPYSRKNNKSLFATAIYPFRYDSLGFPSMMASVSKKLNSNSTYEWSNTSHAHIIVTYNGEKRTYGGQGIGQGKQISEDKLIKRFSFAKKDPAITLESARELLTAYSAVEMEDDVPRDDALTWKQVWDTVGDGAWVKTINGYSYMYQKNDGSYFWTEAANSSGAEIYWGGDIAYASGTWVDGRYVNKYERFEQGATFDQYPTASIILTDYSFPDVTYTKEYKGYDSENKKYIYEYTNVSVTEKKITAGFTYSSTDKVWKVENSVYSNKGYYYLSDLEEMAASGKLNKKYLDAFTLTENEVEALDVDKNTNSVPNSGYLYDRTAAPGTPFCGKPGDANEDGAVDVSDVLLIQQHLAGWNVTINEQNADVDGKKGVSVSDVLLIQQSIAGWNVQFA